MKKQKSTLWDSYEKFITRKLRLFMKSPTLTSMTVSNDFGTVKVTRKTDGRGSVSAIGFSYEGGDELPEEDDDE